MNRLCFILVSLALAGCEPKQLNDKNEYPALLSDWGQIWVKGNRLSVNPEASVYNLNTPLFTDYAHKLRTVWTPLGATGSVNSDGALNLPVGSVVTKTFYYRRQEDRLVHAASEFGKAQGPDLSQARLLETRVLVRTASGWQGLPYLWNEEQTNASLDITGGVIPLEVAGLGRFNYIVPDFNQCQGCHVVNVAAGAMQPIGLTAKHLHKMMQYSGSERNQFEYLAEKHRLTDYETAEYQIRAVWGDDSVSLESAARSYLDINCGHCHSRTGPADTSAMFLTLEENNAIHLGVCKPPVAAGQGTGGYLFGIDPGRGKQSILTFRMQSDDPGAMMPELGRALVHNEGLALITAWIDDMAGNCG